VLNPLKPALEPLDVAQPIESNVDSTYDDRAVPNGNDAVTVACAHCGLPAPRAEDPRMPSFCCHGCRGAYELIRGWGLEEYYALRDSLGGGETGAVVVSDRYAELDDPMLLGRSAPQAAGGDLLVCRLAVSGLHCGACAWLIERSARQVPGWHSARVRMNDHSVDVVFDPRQTKLSQIAVRLGQLGYRLAPMTDGGSHERAAAENRRLLIQIAIAGFCAMNAMWIAVALYAGSFSGMEAEHERALRYAGVLLGLLSVTIPGRTFFRGALASLRTMTPHMDLPIALGIGVGALGGVYSSITGRGDVYFDSIAILVFFLLVGRWVQFRQQRRAAESVGLLMRLAPRTATRVEPDGTTKLVPTDTLRVDDVIRVIAGEGIPADGIVLTGESMLDRSLLTGESRPVLVVVNDGVHAGTANIQSPLEIRVTAVGMESRVGKLMRLVEEAAESKAPVVQLADAIGGWFVAIVIGLALLTVVLWWNISPSRGVENAVALLIVACPCALAMATPLALAVGIGRAAKRKILVRGGDVLEQITKPGMVWFDKTGTLTEGRLHVTELIGDDVDEALAMAAAVERNSNHPAALSIVAEGDRRASRISAKFVAEDVRQVAGGGVVGRVAGRQVVVGHVDFLNGEGIELALAWRDRADAIARSGATPVLIAIDGAVAAGVRIEDELRRDAGQVVDYLISSGWRVGILSGDHPEAVAHVADKLGVPRELACGGLTPEAKLARIQRSQGEGGTVIMVGDGVNDAAALAAADVGVSLRGGAEASLEAAPVYLADGQLLGMQTLWMGAKRTVQVIRRNFVASLTYNAIAVGLAMAGRIDPLVAAILMPISSLTVLTLTLGTPTFRDLEEKQ
jgi:Cu2+-exporting ATPase